MSLDFNSSGSSRRVDHGSGTSIDDIPTGAFTWAGWVNRAANGSNQFLLSKGSSFLVLVDNNSGGEGNLRVVLLRGSNNVDYASAAGAAPLNTDAFVAVTYDPAATPQVRFYAGTAKVLASLLSNAVENAGSGTYSSDAASSLLIGNHGSLTLPFLGTIDRGVFIAGTALGAQEIQVLQMMTATQLGAVSGAKLAFLYTSTSSYSTDYSGNGNTGTLTGATNGTAAAVPTLIAPDATTTLYASANWWSDGSGTKQSNNIFPGSTFIKTPYVGAYVRAKASASSGTPSLFLLFDTSSLNGLTPNKCPYIGVSTDDGPLVFTQLVYSTIGQVIPIATSLTSTAQKIKISWESIDQNSPGDRWSTPAQSVKILGLYRDSSLVTLAAPDVLSGLAYFLGDSVTEGANSNNGTGLTVTENAARFAPPPLVAKTLGCEYATFGMSGVGIETKGIGNVTPSSSAPSLSNSTAANEYYDKFFSGQTALVAGKYSPIPTHIFVTAGVNDGGSLTAAHITTFLDKLATVSDPSTWIWYVTYLSNALSSVAATGVANVARPARTKLIQPPVVITPGTASKYSSDAAVGSQHPNLFGNAQEFVPYVINSVITEMAKLNQVRATSHLGV